MLWHYRASDESESGVDGPELFRLISEGVLDENTPVRRDDEAEFIPLARRFPLAECWTDTLAYRTAPAIIPAGAVRCSLCWNPITAATVFVFAGMSMCDECLPRYFSELCSSAAERPAELPPGVTGCSECKRPMPPSELLVFESHTICAECKDAFFQKRREGVAQSEPELDYAPFMHRVAARIIDGILLSGAAMLVEALTTLTPLNPGAASGVRSILSLSTEAAYFITCHALVGQTAGKRLLKIRVVREDGTPLSFAQSAGRYFATLLSTILLCGGYLIALFDDKVRTLHDRLAFTRVVRAGN